MLKHAYSGILGVFVAVAVLVAAAPGHAVKVEKVVSDPHLRDVWATGVRYHQLHGLALCLVALHPAPRKGMLWLFVTGIVLFSGCQSWQ